MRINLSHNNETRKRLISLCDEYKKETGMNISPTQMIIRLIYDAHKGCTDEQEDKDDLYGSSS